MDFSALKILHVTWFLVTSTGLCYVASTMVGAPWNGVAVFILKGQMRRWRIFSKATLLCGTQAAWLPFPVLHAAAVPWAEINRQSTWQTAGLWISGAQAFVYFLGRRLKNCRGSIFWALGETKCNHSYTAMSLSSLMWDLGIWEDIWNLFMPFRLCNSILNSYNATQ